MANLLVVEDDPGILESTCKFLQDSGHIVAAAPNGREALELLLKKAPDLVLLDLFMPYLDGCSLLEIMRSYLRLQFLPVVVITGLSDSPMIDRARKLRVNTVLVKGKTKLQEIADAVDSELHRVAK